MSEISLATLSKSKNITVTEDTSLSVQSESTQLELTPEERAKISEIKESIDLTDPGTTVQFGIGAQRRLTEFTDSILDNVRSKDGGQVGELLSDLVVEVNSLDPSSLTNDSGILSKLPGVKNAVKGLKKLVERYNKAEVQIDKIEAALEKARMDMLKDISVFDIMYKQNLDCFRELGLYIQAGKERVEEIRTETIPKLRAEAQTSGDPMDAQLVRDFEDEVDRFEKKIYDLELSRTIAVQTAPQIKLIQNNDRVLVDKIQTAVLNTIPVWKSQFVIAMGLNNQQRVLKMQREITDTTNKMLLKNSELLKTNTVETAKESNRGIVDIETLQKVNQNLISTIEETIQIQKEGRQQRAEAEKALGRIEDDLKNKLVEIMDRR
ncbi:MAG: toxic anion resistance protein [Huintestinicola sp.]|uniref:toxic anion resistance protein n=1 Tax=Huintestinicola sp. TaxID=2981661 RepID=UPI003F08E890